eukprot:TRINITY_DN6868_c0_g3_i1.p1 TRINITY_DN6868_c0_g3~~TRINITY_DN6868_c0_g3_i1.p1  ORF type:complete len:575 (-),score=110.02 TRINITY_DN6868_c0_g3_i1:138-1862(-)
MQCSHELESMCTSLHDDVRRLKAEMAEFREDITRCYMQQCKFVDQQTQLTKKMLDMFAADAFNGANLSSQQVHVEVEEESERHSRVSRQSRKSRQSLPLVDQEAGQDEQAKQKKKQRKGAFDFVRDLKQEHKQNLQMEVYDVMNFYKTKGCSQAVARSEMFQNVSLGIVALNALYLGIDADYNDSDSIAHAAWPFFISENIFCVLFTTELLFRFGAFEVKRNCLRDNWFKFDSLLVFVMVTETWLLPLILMGSGGQVVKLPTEPLRLLRLLRLSRMVRLLKVLPELVTMIKGMKAASRAVGCSLLMVFMIIYVFAIMLNLCMKGEEWAEENFATIPGTMWTLTMSGTLLDNIGDVLGGLRDSGDVKAYISVALFMILVLLAAMTVMNMLIGIMCEVISAVASSERDEAAIRQLKETILVELKKHDKDQSGGICKSELETVFLDQGTMKTLKDLDVDVTYVAEVSRMCFDANDENDEVSFETFMELLLMSRGDMSVTVAHMARCHAHFHWLISTELHKLRKHVDNQIMRGMAAVLTVSKETNGVAHPLSTNGSVHIGDLDELRPGPHHSLKKWKS